ncbi:MAG: GDP-mannose 4,6-dehydratase [Arcobacteraceae bacterium]|nr:GDP-mannose 4,6-dehydratase [Arcobacteraceae bacterium]
MQKETGDMQKIMLQQDKPVDYVIATYTIRELAFKEVGIEIVWSGEGVNEKGIDKATGKVLVVVNILDQQKLSYYGEIHQKLCKNLIGNLKHL